MLKHHLVGVFLTLALCSIALAQPQAQVESRQMYTIIAGNPADAAIENAAVEVKLPNNLKPDHLLLLDPSQEPSLALPFQVHEGTLTTVLSFEPKQKRELRLVVTRTPVPLPPFQQKTSADIRNAYRSFENNLMAFRIEVGEKAMTTGLAIDVFGKTARGRNTTLQDIYATPDYHSMSDWGMDILKVGDGPGLGGIYLVLGEETGRTRAEQTEFEIIEQGPVQTVVRASAPVEVAEHKFTLTRTITLTADDRSIGDVVEVRGSAADLRNLLIGVGLRDLPDQRWTERPQDGYAFVAGTGTEGGVKIVGLGVAFDAKQFIAAQDLPEGMGRVYLLKPQPIPGGVRSRHRLSAFWEHDSQITTESRFEQHLQQLAQRVPTTIQARIERPRTGG